MAAGPYWEYCQRSELSHSDHFMAGYAGFGRFWKRIRFQVDGVGAIQEGKIEVPKFLLSLDETISEIGVAFAIPYAGEVLLEEVAETDLLYPRLPAAEDSFERRRQGGMEINTGGDLSVR